MTNVLMKIMKNQYAYLYSVNKSWNAMCYVLNVHITSLQTTGADRDSSCVKSDNLYIQLSTLQVIK